MSEESTTCEHPPSGEHSPPDPPNLHTDPPIPPSGGVIPPAYKPRPANCIVCRHKDRETIDNLLAEGRISQRFLCLKFGFSTHRNFADHKKKCWPSNYVAASAAPGSSGSRGSKRGETPQTPTVEATPQTLTSPEPEVEQSIRKRDDRIRRLDALWLAGHRLQLARAKAYAHIPGGDTGLLVVDRYGQASYDHAFVRAQLALHEAASKETGEWLEQQGRVVAMPTGEAPVVIVIGGGSFQAPYDRRSVPSVRPRVEFPRGAPRARLMAEAGLAQTDIEIEAEAREDTFSGIAPRADGEGEE